ncbi:MAG TPA: ferredoxin reductase family protein [Elusimicrobiota bacterium]|nr:ferredoxin reductase family protein [Elusimicrobiota bacterium]
MPYQLKPWLPVLRLAGPAGDVLAVAGLLGLVAMAALGTRLPWVERRMGLDRVYRVHRLLGMAIPPALILHALLRTVAFSLKHANKSPWSFLFYFGTGNPALLLGHIALYLLILLVPIAIWGRHRLSFWLWKNTHLVLYAAVAVAFSHAWLEGTKGPPDIWSMLFYGAIGACLLSLFVYRLVTRLGLSGRAVWRVHEVMKETADTATLVLERPEGAGPFSKRRAGQFAIIRVMGERGWSEPHPFTISAPPHSDKLHFTIKAAGRFTSAVPGLKRGVQVLCEGPYGVFSPDFEKERDLVFISGGVGITPFLSILRHAAHARVQSRIVLFSCNRTFSDVIAREELSVAAKELSLRVVHVLGKMPEAGAPEGDGRVFYESGRLNAGILSKHCEAKAGASFYLCGPPPMQTAVLRLLKDTFGVPPVKVRRELFFF